jgi:hypothetical protein
MQTKLTVRVDQRWLESAKSYASRHGTTLTKLISDYLEALSGADNLQSDAPILRRLSGILPADVKVDEHRGYLADKYRD